MYYTTTINGAKAYVFDTKDLHKCEVVLSSSSSVRTLSTLSYDDIDKSKYREVARVNASIFNMADSTHQGWEYSDVYKSACGADSRADAMQFKDGTILMGDISKDDVTLTDIKWAYSGSHVILQDGKDVTITATWRTAYPNGTYCWSWFASREDGTYVIGAIDGNHKVDTPSLRNFLKGLGCNNVMVNDGGGSAELIVNSKIVNRASERKIANGLFIYELIQDDTNTSEEVKQRLNALKSHVDKELDAIKELL